MNIGVIGGGAAGFFAAINIAEKCPNATVAVLEKTSKVLQKVKVSGGGRCNVTNGRQSAAELVPFYPRGGKKLYRPFKEFGTVRMREWLAHRGVETKVEADQRAFPASDSSQTIIDCFLRECQRLKIDILKNHSVEVIARHDQWQVTTKDREFSFDKLVIATGASEKSWQWLEGMGLPLEPRVPSLFTFNIKDPRLQGLQGLSFPEVAVKVAGTKLQSSGPLLITHWGLSGPAILKLSAVGARALAERGYQFQIIVSLTNQSQDTFIDWLRSSIASHPNKQISNLKAPIPQRYWLNLLSLLEISEWTPLSQLTKKAINQVSEELTQASFSVQGKSTFKEEFVTCGGVALSAVDLTSMQSRQLPGLYLAGEVLNIDALTGGFNFQSCWTAGWLISEHLKGI